MYNLGFLALDSNKISNLCPISEMSSLKTLIISNNQINSLSCLAGLRNITDLLADNNQIVNLDGLETLKKLTWLNLENNQITDLTTIAGLPSLEHLYLTKNKITDIHPLLSVPSLYDIHFAKNPLNSTASNITKQLIVNGALINPADAPTKPSVISVYLDDKRIRFNQAPFIEKGNTLVQFRPLFETLGLSIVWNSTTQTVIGEKAGLKLELQIGSTKAIINGKTYTAPVAPINKAGNTFIPTRLVAEAMKYDVTWDSDKSAVRIYTALQTLKASDDKSLLKLSHQWKPMTTDNPLIKNMANNATNNRSIMVLSEPKDELIGIKTLEQYWAAVKLAITQAGVTEISDFMPTKVDGLKALTFEISQKINGMNLKMYIALVENKDYFYRIALNSMDNDSNNPQTDFQDILNTFQVLTSFDEQIETKFGKLTPLERLLDSANYYRKLGFFQSMSALSDTDFNKYFVDYYQTQNYADDSNPFYNKNLYMGYADPYVLELDKERVWSGDTEAEVGNGNEIYITLLKKLSALSHGVFQPSDITEQWLTDVGPIKVEFSLNGVKHAVHPLHMSDFIDMSIVGELNKLILDSGYQFAVVFNDQTATVVLLKTDEFKKIAEDRVLSFEEFQ